MNFTSKIKLHFKSINNIILVFDPDVINNQEEKTKDELYDFSLKTLEFLN